MDDVGDADADGDPAVYPGSAEDIGDGIDADGYAAGAACDDARADVHPGASEVCNTLDDDCDGVTDPDTAVGASVSGALSWTATVGRTTASRASRATRRWASSR